MKPPPIRDQSESSQISQSQGFFSKLLDWASTQNNLGTALARLGERESGTARLEEAVAAYREALQERTRARVPLDWAMTQNNLGSALSNLAGRGGRAGGGGGGRVG